MKIFAVLGFMYMLVFFGLIYALFKTRPDLDEV